MSDQSPRGMRPMFGREVEVFREVTRKIVGHLECHGYREFVPSAVANQSVFVDKAGEQVLGQMYDFPDKGGRSLCLIPEVTAICTGIYKSTWSKSLPKPVKLWYLARCYRYERPQAGRYREFWQLGAEHMGGVTSRTEMTVLLQDCLDIAGLGDYTMNPAVKRGLDYYTEDGFEVECDRLGAQKQVAGGGRYDCGIGWAIGVDRLMIALHGPDIIGAV